MGKGSEEGHKSDLLPIKLSEMLKELYLLMLFKGSKGVKVITRTHIEKRFPAAHYPIFQELKTC